jgi:signal transduction histidine kinase
MPATGSERPVRWTVRLRLTLAYGVLFLLSGVALLAVTFALYRTHSGTFLLDRHVTPGTTAVVPDPQAVQEQMTRMREEAEAQRAAVQHELLVQSGVALALMSTVSVALGWLMAGRALRPVRTMTERARRLSERNLHERLAVRGPDDELKELGDTFDGLLSRLDAAFGAQQRFVANASHELRTPLTLQRALIEVALADPAADAGSLRRVCERVLAAGEQQEHLIEALLTLARSQRGVERRTPVDLARLAAGALPEPGAGRPRVDAALAPALAAADPRLVERLIANLVGNALRHNVPGGWVHVATATEAGRPVLRVVNSGPVIPPERIGALFQPFQRHESRTGSPEGHGLGLSIVAAVAAAHGAHLTARPGPQGGLDISVGFATA